jgi:hypothetical protein
VHLCVAGYQGEQRCGCLAEAVFELASEAAAVELGEVGVGDVLVRVVAME